MTERRAVAGLILAAGGGSRLGGRPKALLDFHGEPLVERAARAARAGGCEPVVVVLGAAADQVIAGTRLDRARVVRNDGWQTGMGSSLRAGISALPRTAGAVVVLLVDQPFVDERAVRAVVETYQSGANLVSAGYGERRGHPVLFAAAHWDAVAASATGDRGARGFLAAHEREIVMVRCDGFADPADIDTPADLAALRRR